MTDQEQQRACAELDGHSWVILNYNTYDAIIPLIQKQFIHHYQWLDFERELAKLCGFCTTILYSRDALRATPTQLREALLRSTDRWID